MITPLIFVCAACLSLLLLLYLFKRHAVMRADLDQLAAQLRPVDVAAFRNLIDEREEEFLRDRLPARVFSSVHRIRMLAAAEYVRCAARNAGILVRLAEAAKNDPDPEIAAAAEGLLDNALSVRLYAFQVVPRLYLSALIPSVKHTPQTVAEKYDVATRQMTILRALRSPARATSRAM
jgi:hypothetical protein